MSAGPKFCTNCGAQLVDRRGRPACQLYDEELHRKSNILKLMSCQVCGGVADKYIECDGPLVLIDLVLQSREAYRHVLFNGGYAGPILRMAVLALICDAYIACDRGLGSAAGLPFEFEQRFYAVCLKFVLALSMFLTVVVLPLAGRMPAESLGKLALGLLMAYGSRFCNLIALLWASDDMSSAGLMWASVSLLFYVSTVRVYQVTRGSGLVVSLAHLAVAHVVFVVLMRRSPIGGLSA